MIRYTKDYIARLLDRFMEGTSTLEEEDILSSYFRGKDVPQEWEDYRQMFMEIDAMRPQPKSSRRWIGWSVAAAVVAGVLCAIVPSLKDGQALQDPLVAQADTVTVLQSEKPQTGLMPDTTIQRQEQMVPVQTKKRRIRKMEPTIHDYDKAYTLMAQVEQEEREAEWQLEQCQQEIIEAQLAAYGFVPVMQEDGTIIYINEQTDFIAYEE